MLAMQVEFLTDLDTLAGRALLDWPPQRCQLLCALADAAQQHALGASAHAALLWLEAQFPPATHAVPSPPHVRPRRLTVTYRWHDANPDPTVRRILNDVARHVIVLGGERTPVCVRLGDSTDDSDMTTNRSRRTGRRFRPNPVRPATPPHAGPFGDMLVFRLRGAPHTLDVTDTLDTVTRLRAAVLKLCGHPDVPVPEVLSGHQLDGRPSERPHAAYVALPRVSPDRPDADGRIAGLAIVLPADVNTRDRRCVRDVAVGVRELWLPGGRSLRVELLGGCDSVPGVLRPQTWSGPARVWTSATPVVLDRFPRRDGSDLEETVRVSCSNLGLPDGVEVFADHASRLFGVPDSDRFDIRRDEAWQHHTLTEERPGEPPRPSRHVTLVFPVPVRGPLLLGHSRYFGLGLLRPLPELTRSGPRACPR